MTSIPPGGRGRRSPNGSDKATGKDKKKAERTDRSDSREAIPIGLDPALASERTSPGPGPNPARLDRKLVRGSLPSEAPFGTATAVKLPRGQVFMPGAAKPPAESVEAERKKSWIALTGKADDYPGPSKAKMPEPGSRFSWSNASETTSPPQSPSRDSGKSEGSKTKRPKK